MSRRRDLMMLCLLLVVGGVVLFRGLGTASFYGDEAIYAQVAHESASDGWLPLHYRGHVYRHKPPLRMLINAALFRTVGESEFIARVPDALLGLGLLALVFWHGRRWFGLLPAAAAALLLLCSKGLLVHHGLRDAVTEATLVFLGTAMLLLWLRHVETGRRWHLCLAGLCAAALGLVKNPLSGVLLALVLVGLSVAEAAVARNWRIARGGTWLVPGGALVIWAAWVIYMEIVTPGSYLAFLYRDVVVRATASLNPGHLRPAFYYGGVLWREFGWWLLLALPAGWGAWRHVRDHGVDAADRARFHLFAWSSALVAIFTVAAAKNAWYIYPAFPALTLFLASGVPVLCDVLRRGSPLLLPGLGAALALFMTVDLLRTWDRVGRDVHVLDVHRFALAYGRLDNAELRVDLEALRKHGPFRSWSWYYLSNLEGVRMGSTGVDLPLPVERCTYVATPEPEVYKRRGWQWELPVRRIAPREAAFSIVGTCPLDLPAGAGRP